MSTQNKIEAILASYPRKRPPLTSAHKALYVEEYKKNRVGHHKADNLAQTLESWMHRQIITHKSSNLLEIGAGTLNHVSYEDSNTVYEIVEPFSDLYRNNSQLNQIQEIYDSLDEIPESKKYSRIVSIAVLEHMTNLPMEIALSIKHMESNGIFQAGIPNEGGFLWWLGWRLTTGISYWLRNRLDYGVLMRHEHVNKADEIITIVDYLFENLKIKRFPTPFHSLSFYSYLEATNPYMARVEKIISTQK